MREAVKDLEAEVSKVTDYSEINNFGVMRTPALVINNEVMSSGKVLSVTEIKAMVKQYVKYTIGYNPI